MIDDPHEQPFDLRGSLPTGVTVLEASAGTGKTYTIAALAARYIAQGTPLHRLLLVTFTRMATGELRERVRERLVSVEHGLRQALAGITAQDGDPIVELLADGPSERIERRRTRLARALADFDAATIATTHGFCQEVLGGLGIAADLEPDTAFVEDLSDLVADVVDDLYVRRFHRGAAPAFDLDQAMEIARVAVANPSARIVPAYGETPEMRRRLACAVREELERRKRRLAVMTYDDLLTRLHASLSGDAGAATAERLRDRYDVVLVDEFQDTDPVQWDIMHRAFGEGGGTLVLIADPKQAIYAFRGADVYAYLDAAHGAAAHATLNINWRSDQRLIDAYDALFAGTTLGHEGIAYRRVQAAAANQAPRLSGAPVDAPLRIRVVDRTAVAQTPTGLAKADSARRHIATDLAADLSALLSSPAEIELRSQNGATIDRRPVRPAHVAVLVPTNRNAALIREALEQAGIPAVINGAGSVFATDAAREWLALLEALERPASTARAHSVALTGFLGWSSERVACAEELAWEHVHRALHEWARVLRSTGVASLLEVVTLVEGLPARILAHADGERRLTDIRHIAQLLHEAASTEPLGTTALAAWLRRRMAEAHDDTGDEERSRRLDSDAEAVQVLTIHRSKGLEFPIVYLPFLWEPSYISREARPVLFHDPDAGDERAIDVSLEGPDFDLHRTHYLHERRGEDLRLAYVALTRACHQAVLWWAGSWDSRNSPLGRLLFSRDHDGNVAPIGTSTPTDAAARARFRQLADDAHGAVTVEPATPGAPHPYREPPVTPATLTAAPFDRALDLRWRRTSYTDITAGSYDASVASEPDEPLISDEPADAQATPFLARSSPPSDHDLSAPSLLSEMPVGARIGTFVHGVLEATDFAAAALERELHAHVQARLGPRAIEIGDPAIVVAGLRAAIETPLGPLLGGAALCDFQLSDRLDELEFELPLVGGDEPTGWLTLAGVAAAVRRHLPAEDPLAGYAERLEDQSLRAQVRGYLTGILDLVVRIPGADGPRFAVLDYKTNWLAGPEEPLTLFHHRPSALAAVMARHHYGLQALLYTVALHRYLRWRLPAYEPERHLAGVAYLFLRGMVGPDTPIVDGMRCGVFAWRPPGALVTELSDLLDRGGAP
jgi:exodeoxyribonuclease V beta subunit